MERRGLHRGDHDEDGVEPVGGVRDGVDRGVGAEVAEAPAVLAQREPEAQQPELVALAGGAREDRAGTVPAAPAPGEAAQPARDERAPEVLLRDPDVPLLPARAEVGEHRQHGVAEDRVEREPGQQAVDRGAGPGVVEVLDGGRQVAGHPGQRAVAAAVRRRGARRVQVVDAAPARAGRPPRPRSRAPAARASGAHESRQRPSTGAGRPRCAVVAAVRSAVPRRARRPVTPRRGGSARRSGARRSPYRETLYRPDDP